MNIIKVKFAIDIDNATQVELLNNFIADLRGTSTGGAVVTAPIKDVKVKQEPAAQQPAAQPTTQQPAMQQPKMLDSIRKLISENVENNRAEIKAKLVELGAATATDLTVDKYQEMHDWLSSLS